MLREMASLLAACYPKITSSSGIPDDLQNLKTQFHLFAQMACTPNPIYQHIYLNMPDGFCREELAIFSCMLAFRAAVTLNDLVSRDMMMRCAGVHSWENVRNILDELGRGSPDQPSHFVLLYESLQIFAKMLDDIKGYGCGPRPVDDSATFAVLNQVIELRRNGHQFNLPPKGSAGYAEALQRNETLYRSATATQISPLDVQGEWRNEKVRIWAGFFPITANSLTCNVEGVNIGYHFDQNAHTLRLAHALDLAALLPDDIIDYDRQTRKNILALQNTQTSPHGMDARSILTIAMEILARESNAQARSQIGAYLDLCRNYSGHVTSTIGQSADSKVKRLLLWSDIHVGDHGVEGEHAAAALAMQRLFMDTLRKPDPTYVSDALEFVRTRGFLHHQSKLMETCARAMQEARARARIAEKETGNPMFILPLAPPYYGNGLSGYLRKYLIQQQLG